MKIFLFVCCLFSTGLIFAQPSSIYYNHGGLYVNGRLLEENASKTFVDSVFGARSKNGTIIRTHDVILDTDLGERRRAFHFPDFGVWYRRSINDPSMYSLSVRFVYNLLSNRPKKDSLQVYTGELKIGKTLITKQTRLDELLADKDFRLVKKGEVTTKKYQYPYAVVAFQDVLLKMSFLPQDAALWVIEIAK